jgi:hypothetical protein
LFFIGKGFGYGLSGLLHQFIHATDVSDDNEILWRTSFVLVIVGNAGLALLVAEIFIHVHKLPTCRGWLIYSIAVIVNLGAFAAIVTHRAVDVTGGVDVAVDVTGAVTSATAVFATALFCMKASFVKALGAFIMGAGFVVHLMLDQTCGNNAYRDCWKECILPAPHFNHNALYHVLVALGMLMLAFAMVCAPDMTEPITISVGEAELELVAMKH